MSTTTIRVIRFIIAVVGITLFVRAYDTQSALYLAMGVVAVIISLVFKKLIKQKPEDE